MMTLSSKLPTLLTLVIESLKNLFSAIVSNFDHVSHNLNSISDPFMGTFCYDCSEGWVPSDDQLDCLPGKEEF